MPKSHLDITRIQALTDATFAVAMTILVLEIKLPTGFNPDELFDFFWDTVVHGLFIYFLSFVVLGVFWIGTQFHHHLILQTDRVSSWLNIAFLMFICLIPFSSGFLIHYRQEKLGIIFYSLNLIMASLLHYFKLSYAWQKGFIKPHVTPIAYKNAKVRILIPILIYGLAIPVSFLSPKWAILLFIIPIIIHIIPEKMNQHST